MVGQMTSESLERIYLNDLRKRRMSVVVYLVSGVRQPGMIESFDQYTILLRQGGSTQLVYKHMISSVIPATSSLPALTSLPAHRMGSRTDVTAGPQVTRKAPRRVIKPSE
jgi:host factor-I protein